MSKKYITTTEAADYVADKIGFTPTNPTIITWCKPREDGGWGIGRKVGGRWVVEVKLLNLLIDGRLWRSKEEK